ncbi:MAG: amidohydrolase family protein [Phycisphaerales bacterium]|nr:amidohydrolase family protein [Phycisphaerales bacterium]
MIVDCHTQIWNHQTPPIYAGLADAGVRADESRHLAAADPVDKAIVLAFKSTYLGSEIPNRFVAEYVRRNPGKMIGFAGIDPTDRDWMEELRIAQHDLQLKGVAIAPALQDFHPSDTRAMRLYEECARRGLPLLFEQGHRNPAAKMEFAQPMLIDAVAREFPTLRIVVARLGFPWVHQAVVLLAKHANVYADVAGLLPHPWLSYSALLAAHEYGVMNKLLFGSDFPFRSPAACIEALYSVNQFSHAGSLPPIPREQLRGIVERDALALLGIETHSPATAVPSTIFADED